MRSDPANPHVPTARSYGAFLIPTLLVCCAPSWAQTPAPKPGSNNNPPEEAIILDPFEVKTEKDNSYGALNSNSIGLFSMELAKTPVVADILTAQFIQDTASRSLEELYGNYAGSAGMVLATPESDGTATRPGDRFSTAQYGVRGLSAGRPRRDGFAFTATHQNATNLFSTERVDVIHGSQGLLYGATGAGGIINVVSKQARFKSQAMTLSDRTDQFGSHQDTLDANWGLSNVGVRFVALHDKNRTRRLFIGDDTEGYYGQVAFRFHLGDIQNTVRLTAEETHNNRITPANLTVNFGSTAVDPRHGYRLDQLLYTGKLGAINPDTGLPYPGGAIGNGHLDANNIQSLLGWRNEETVDNTIWEATVDTVWTKWLTTSFGALWDNSQEMRDPNGSNLYSPLNTTNTTGDWAVSPSFTDSESPDHKKSYRAAALFTNDLFNGRVHSQTSLGFDRQYADGGGATYFYYLANPDGSVSIDPTKSDLGRTRLPTVWVNVGQGPVYNPYSRVAARQITYNGQLYALMAANPRDPAWVSANNPLGLASLVPTIKGINTGSGGTNQGSDSQQRRDQGYYIANYSSWFDDRMQILLGMRKSDTFTRNANTDISIPDGYIETRSGPYPSYNAGVNYRVMRLPHAGEVSAYYGYSRTFNTTVGNADAYGVLPVNPVGETHEIGIKFNALDNRVSGSATAFVADSKNDNYSAGSGYRDTVNPNGLNGAFVGKDGAKGNFAKYDKTSRGLELILTANPTHDWRVRVATSLSDGKVKTDSVYPLLYNDQFYADKSGNVTYSDGQPFLVPVDATTVTKVGKQTTLIDPSAYGVAMVPLTIAMLNGTDPNDPNRYYTAFGPNTLPQNQPLSGSIGAGSNATLKNALLNFRKGTAQALTGATGLPISAMQYAWSDPGGYRQNGYVVQRKGDATVGYPVVRVNVTNDYTFSKTWLKGLHVGGSVALAWYNRTYFFNMPDRSRHLYGLAVENPTVNTWIGYAHRFRRVTWSSQVNVNNMFNKYDINFTPNNGTGFTNPVNVGVSYSGEPRYYVWTNKVSF
jgi:outer membrane receptor protein involved in Fe transport